MEYRWYQLDRMKIKGIVKTVKDSPGNKTYPNLVLVDIGFNGHHIYRGGIGDGCPELAKGDSVIAIAKRGLFSQVMFEDESGIYSEILEIRKI
jgi:hypothetical protein